MPAPSALPADQRGGARAHDRVDDALVVRGGRWPGSSSWSPPSGGSWTSGGTSRTCRSSTTTERRIRRVRSVAVHKEEGPNGAPALAARYAAAFAAYLSDRGELGLGAAYDLGREAVTAHLSVLDLAEAHHEALRAALARGGSRAAGGHRAGRRRLPAREPVDVRERPPRLPGGPGGRPARARARGAAARAGRGLGGDQLLDDGRGDPPADRRRTPAGSSASDGRRSPSTRPTRGCGRSPPPRRGSSSPATPEPRASVRHAQRPRRASWGCSTSSTTPGASSPRATRRSSPSSPRSPPWPSPTPRCTSASARSPARCSAACGRARCPTVPGSGRRRALPPRRREHRAGRGLLRPLSAPATAAGRR